MDLLNRDSGAASNRIQTTVKKLDERARDFKSVFAGRGSIAMESMSDADRKLIGEAAAGVDVVLESLRAELGIKDNFISSQKHSAQQAALLGASPKAFLGMSLRDGFTGGANSGNAITLESLAPAVPRYIAAESYDERDNKSAVAYSVAYNLNSSRQDEFGEALYPTITIPADQAAVTVSVNLMYVLDNIDRNVSGAEYKLLRKNLLRAVADHTVLRKDQTRAVPVVRAQSEDKFVDAAVLAPVTVNYDGTDIETAPLLFNTPIDLLGISQSDAMVAAGVQNQTDTLEAAADVIAIYMSVGAGGNSNTLKFKTQGLPFFNFVPAVQGDYKDMSLSAETTSIILNDQSVRLNVDGTTAALRGALAQITTEHLIVKMHGVFTGKLRPDTGNVTVYANELKVAEIFKDGVSIALTDASVTTLVAALNDNTKLGYDVLAYRSNQNRRQQGQFVDVAKQHQRYMIPLLSPISTRHPAHVDGQIDASDVQALITATRIRTANEAVTATLNALDMLASFVDVRDTAGEAPDVLGIGRHFVRPAYLARPFDASTMVDSTKSHERTADIASALVNQLRDMAYTLYRDSEYKAAADALNGGAGPIPTVILATDPYTARYLTTDGDLRTLGGEFQVQVVSTLDKRMRGKIVVAFAVFDGDRNAAINPLNNGNMLWAPELVLTANISRGGSYNRETVVQPRFRFIQNLPVMGVLNVSNIPNTLGKVPLYMVDATP